MALDMEYRLTIGYRLGCRCARYFVQRREVLIPAVLECAERRGIDPVDLFAEYARAAHANHHEQMRPAS
jgi:hypothetical protein